MPHTFVTHSQRLADRQLHSLERSAVTAVRAVTSSRHDIARAVADRDEFKHLNPDLAQSDVRQGVDQRRFTAAIVAAIGLDVILAGPVGEYLLTNFLKVQAEDASLAKYGVPLLVIATEMGVARWRASEDAPLSQRVFATLVALGFIIVMPLLVGETAALAESGGKLGLFDQMPSVLILVMIGLTLCVHAFILFTGEQQLEALSRWAATRKLRRFSHIESSAREAERRNTQATVDRFTAWARQREFYLRDFPDVTPPSPNWGVEAIDIINTAFGEEVIRRPAGAGRQSRATAQPREPHTGTDQDVRDAQQRRRRDSEAEVDGD